MRQMDHTLCLQIAHEYIYVNDNLVDFVISKNSPPHSKIAVLTQIEVLKKCCVLTISTVKDF